MHLAWSDDRTRSSSANHTETENSTNHHSPQQQPGDPHKPQPDANLRDTENVPLREDVQAYFKQEMLPHAPDVWIDHDKTKVDAELKVVTDRILTMIGRPSE